jgi:polar amino acid transport system permease protein
VNQGTAVSSGDMEQSKRFEPMVVRSSPHPGRWLAAVVVLLLAAMMAYSVVRDAGFQWGVVGHYFLATPILQGIRITLELTAICMGLGIVLGILLAVMRLSPNWVLSSASRFYTWFFRGTPVLVQLIFWYNIGALYPHFSLGLPFGPVFFSVSANSVITPLSAAILGLGLNEGAYMAEIVRGGVLSVPHGQSEAAMALGMSRNRVMWKVVLPQALRAIVPPTGNEVIGMLKWTALASVIALADLLYATELIYARTFQPIPLLVVASIWYLIMTTVLSVGQYFIEKRFGRWTTGLGGSTGSWGVPFSWARSFVGRARAR